MNRLLVSAAFVSFFLPPLEVLAGVTVSVETQTVSLSGTSTIEIKVFGDSTTAVANATSLSMKADIGVDVSQALGSAARHTPNALPAGFSFPATIVGGGEVANLGWVPIVNTNPASSELADFTVTTSTPFGAPPSSGIDLSSGPVHLFSIFLNASTAAAGQTFIDLATFSGSAFSPTEIPDPAYAPGSVTIQATAVPEPTAFVLLGVLTPMLVVRRKVYLSEEG